ncbi:MAG: hypothetical protein HWN67_12405 [Candidatus Helarchaeota archaeon]|nr:hypothetical protein [Candidatus Helarchaeota archaeon]
MNNPRKHLISLTHIEDVDGIGAQAILLRKFPNIICFQTFYSEFNEFIKKIFDLNPDILYITDIGFNESYREVYEILGKMKNVCWIDHHLISEPDKAELKKYIKNFIHATDKTVAAELTQQIFLPDDEISKKIAKLGYFRDNTIENFESDRLQAIIEINQNNRKNIQKIVELLSKGEFKNKWIQEQYNIYLKEEKIEYKKLEDRAREFQIKRVKVVISFSPFFATGKQTRYLLKNFNADIVFGVNPRFQLVSIKSHDINVKKIAEEFGGGGHFDRSGFSYANLLDENDKLSSEFIEKVLKAVRENLD